MDDWEYIESRYDSLSDQLETAKKHILKVHVDFETRVRVWRDQVLPDRLMQLKKHLSLDTAIRFYDLTFKDTVRLYRRATKEFLEVADDVERPKDKLRYHQTLYIERKKLLMYMHDGFVNDLRDIVETYNKEVEKNGNI